MGLIDQKIISTLSTTSKLWLVVLGFAFLTSCEKKPKTIIHSDIFEAEINGTKYEFTKLSYGGTVGQFFYVQGVHNGRDRLNTYLSFSTCNLAKWPSDNTISLIRETCTQLNTETYAQLFVIKDFSSSRYINDSIPNPHTSVTFEKFEAIDGNNYEFKGTFKMALARSDEHNPLSLPDSCFITGRFHLKRPTRTTVD